MLRSEDMTLILLYINRDCAKNIVTHIGFTNMVHFINLNENVSIDRLPFTSKLKELEKIKQRINFLSSEIKKMEERIKEEKDEENEVNALERKDDVHTEKEPHKEEEGAEEKINDEMRNSKRKMQIDINFDNQNFMQESRRLLKLFNNIEEDNNNSCVTSVEPQINIKTKAKQNTAYLDFEEGDGADDELLSAKQFYEREIQTIQQDNTAEEVEAHYMRYLALLEIRKETNARLEKLNQTVAVLEVLESHVCVDSASSLEEYLSNLDFISFTIHKEKIVLLERIIRQCLRCNVMVHRGTNNISDRSIYVMFTHGDKAILKIRNIVESLQGSIIDLETIKHGSLRLKTHLTQVMKIYRNNENALQSELIGIKEQIQAWDDIICRDVRVFKVLNGMGYSEGSLISQAWVMKSDTMRTKRLCSFLSNKIGCLSIQILKEYINNDVAVNLRIEDVGYFNDNPQFLNKPINDTSSAEETAKASTLNESNDVEVMPHHEATNNNSSPEALSDEISNRSGGNNDSIQDNTEQMTDVKNVKTNLGINPGFFKNSELKLEEPESPPTTFRLNRFTLCSQELNDVYGVPRFKEINPALFQLFSFPFLFGVMFPDVGHGIMLAMAALFFIYYEKTLKLDEITDMVFQGRYPLLICSIWSIFFGLLFGECFGYPLAIFPSQYISTDLGKSFIKISDSPCIFGVDSVWHHSARNGISFLNSLKMKMSIILGFFHLSIGITLGIFNAKYFRDKIALYLVLLPQAICFFLFTGYLVFLIFQKWFFGGTHSILSVIIDMYTHPLSVGNIYPGQFYVQLLIISLIGVSLPFSLLSKPIYCTRKKMKGLDEIWIHSFIDTIEACIGLISNINSYLRIWAVNLAHSELSKVLNSMTLDSSKSLLIKFFALIIWLPATLIVLIALEGLSTSLHSLRLNWIEFGGRFYKGDGYQFKPLRFDIEDESNDN